VSAYIPNTQYGATLPGLSIVQHVRHLQAVVSALDSLDQAIENQTPPEAIGERSQNSENCE
jgi:hypothetical protein